MHFPGGPEMAMPPNGTGLAGQQPQPPAPAGAQNPGPASAAAPGATYEAKIEIAHKHAADAASRDAKRACQPGVNVPFADLDDAIARLLPYHVFSAADEDELDLSVVPPIREDDDAEKTSADAPAPARVARAGVGGVACGVRARVRPGAGVQAPARGGQGRRRVGIWRGAERDGGRRSRGGSGVRSGTGDERAGSRFGISSPGSFGSGRGYTGDPGIPDQKPEPRGGVPGRREDPGGGEAPGRRRARARARARRRN